MSVCVRGAVFLLRSEVSFILEETNKQTQHRLRLRSWSPKPLACWVHTENAWELGGEQGLVRKLSARSFQLRTKITKLRKPRVPKKPRNADFRLTTVRKWITDGRVVREEQRDTSGGLTTRRASVAFAAR